jgi:hypothetical protein
MTADEFDEKYTGNPNFNSDGEEGQEGYMETFSPHIERVLEQNKTNPRTVWTIIEGDGWDDDEDDNTWIVAGYHLVNRLKYFISNEEWESEDEQYQW